MVVRDKVPPFALAITTLFIDVSALIWFVRSVAMDEGVLFCPYEDVFE
jgi:hypothetical protein